MNRMVAANFVVGHPLIFARVLFVKKFIVYNFSQRSEVKMSEAVFLSTIFGGL